MSAEAAYATVLHSTSFTGPTTTPQPGPLQPAVSDLLDAPAVLEPPDEIWYDAAAPSFLAEVSARGGAAVALRGAGAELVRITLRPELWVRKVSPEDVIARIMAAVPVPRTDPSTAAAR